MAVFQIRPVEIVIHPELPRRTLCNITPRETIAGETNCGKNHKVGNFSCPLRSLLVHPENAIQHC
jgi:hypothetical protein